MNFSSIYMNLFYVFEFVWRIFSDFFLRKISLIFCLYYDLFCRRKSNYFDVHL